MRFLFPILVSLCLAWWGAGHGGEPSTLQEGTLEPLQLEEYVPPLRERIKAEGARWDIPPEIALGLVRVESNFDSTAVSHAGAIGLTQVMPATGEWHCGLKPHQLYDASANLECGFSYLRYLHDWFGSWPRALAAYNTGPARHIRAPRTGEYDGYSYAFRVLSD